MFSPVSPASTRQRLELCLSFSRPTFFLLHRKVAAYLIALIRGASECSRASSKTGRIMDPELRSLRHRIHFLLHLACYANSQDFARIIISPIDKGKGTREAAFRRLRTSSHLLCCLALVSSLVICLFSCSTDKSPWRMRVRRRTKMPSIPSSSRPRSLTRSAAANPLPLYHPPSPRAPSAC